MELSDITAFLFSGAVVLIGSLAFHISALISGSNIYRDISETESAWLSMVAGIVIFYYPLSVSSSSQTPPLTTLIFQHKFLILRFCLHFLAVQSVLDWFLGR